MNGGKQEMTDATENALIERRANHFRRSIYADGGKIALYESEISFTPHKFNLSGGELTIPIDEIEDIEIVDMGGFSPQLIFELKDGRKDRFVMWDRIDFKRKVEELMERSTE